MLFKTNIMHRSVPHLREKKAFSVYPVTAVAMASMKVMMPKVAWTGTRPARNLVVPCSQHSKIQKLKNPTTS